MTEQKLVKFVTDVIINHFEGVDDSCDDYEYYHSIYGNAGEDLVDILMAKFGGEDEEGNYNIFIPLADEDLPVEVELAKKIVSTFNENEVGEIYTLAEAVIANHEDN